MSDEAKVPDKNPQETINVRMPNGQLITNVPVGTTKKELLAKLKRNGYDTQALLQAPSPNTNATTIPDAANYQSSLSSANDWVLGLILTLVVVIAIISFAVYKTLNKLAEDAAAVAERAREERAEQERASSERVRPEQADQERADKAQSEKAQAEAQQEKARPWYEVLGVNKNTSDSDITIAYKQLIAKYHPDKVSGLGEEFQTIAERKSREINNAYAAYKQQRG